MPAISLSNRSVVEISGEEAEHFLDNLVTCQVVGLSDNDARFGALLTPQGKILYDFFLIRCHDGYLIDAPALLTDDLVKRLIFYRLRAKVEINERRDLNVVACWDCDKPAGSLVICDPRHKGMGYRVYGSETGKEDDAAYRELRISNSVAEGGIDFEYGAAYPHEVLMDQFGGIDFKKGCYVGQEVVSRMQHRGSAKKRLVGISTDSENLEKGADITADEKPAGKVGSTHRGDGLAILRLDRVALATSVMANGDTLTVRIPDWVDFSWPEAK